MLSISPWSKAVGQNVHTFGTVPQETDTTVAVVMEHNLTLAINQCSQLIMTSALAQRRPALQVMTKSKGAYANNMVVYTTCLRPMLVPIVTNASSLALHWITMNRIISSLALIRHGRWPTSESNTTAATTKKARTLKNGTRLSWMNFCSSLTCGMTLPRSLLHFCTRRVNCRSAYKTPRKCKGSFATTTKSRTSQLSWWTTQQTMRPDLSRHSQLTMHRLWSFSSCWRTAETSSEVCITANSKKQWHQERTD